MTLQQQQVKDLAEIEGQYGNPVFTYLPDGNTYPCKGSITDTTSTLAGGGFDVERTLSLTVRLYNFSQATDGTVTLTSIFSNGIPQPQKKLMYFGDAYRIISVKRNVSGAYIRILAAGTTRGLSK